jgi:hypothetical protein
MPFHVSGRKPRLRAKTFRFPFGYRLLLATLGAALAWFGSLPRNPANFGYLNWRGQPVYPNGLAPLGAVLLIVCFVPASWIEGIIERLVR